MKRLAVKTVLLAILSVSISGIVRAQQFSVSTNVMGYVDFGTLNMEASYAFARHWSVTAGARFNPFTFYPDTDEQMQRRQQAYNIGIRMWPWHTFAGWWVAGKLQYQEYSRGGIVSRDTEEGDGYGIGFSAGYTYMLHPNLNLEFGLGLWSGVKKYRIYDCPSCGVTQEEGTKGFILPNEIIIALSYVF